MSSRKYPRIEIDQRAYDALQVESIREHRTSREIATEAIIGYVSKDAITFIDRMTVGPIDQPTTIKDVEPETIEEVCIPVKTKSKSKSESKDKKPSLRNDPIAQDEIYKLYKSKMSIRKIADQIGRPASTVRDFINTQIKAGDLDRR